MQSGDQAMVAEKCWDLSVGFLSDTGLARERNEDALAVHLPYAGEPRGGPVEALFVVADGMGGHEAGDVASRFAADRMLFELTTPNPSWLEPWPLAERLERVMQELNAELLLLAEERQIGRGVGTTLTAAALRGSTLHLAHIGDSRCYRLRSGELTRLTEDHSWVAEQCRAGLLTPEEAESHPRRNILTRCLGLDPTIQVFQSTEELAPGDRYLLCTDGLYGAVGDSVLGRVLREAADPQEAARRLIALANEAGGADNITAVVVDVALRPVLEATVPGTLPAVEAIPVPAGPVVPAGQPVPGRAYRVLMLLGALLVAAALATGVFLTLHDDGAAALGAGTKSPAATAPTRSPAEPQKPANTKPNVPGTRE